MIKEPSANHSSMKVLYPMLSTKNMLASPDIVLTGLDKIYNDTLVLNTITPLFINNIGFTISQITL